MRATVVEGLKVSESQLPRRQEVHSTPPAEANLRRVSWKVHLSMTPSQAASSGADDILQWQGHRAFAAGSIHRRRQLATTNPLRNPWVTKLKTHSERPGPSSPFASKDGSAGAIVGESEDRTQQFHGFELRSM